MRFPSNLRRGRSAEAGAHRAAYSASTRSVGVAVNDAAARVFDTTERACATSAKGTACTFAIDAPSGVDRFTVSTYSGTAGTGTLLDRGIATVNVVAPSSRVADVTLGPIVSTTSNSGKGSLRYAVASANPGDTITFTIAAGAKIALTTPITVSNDVSISGPGVTSSARGADGKHSSTTYTGITIDGGGTTQLFVVAPGGKTTIAGLILTGGKATAPNQPGGAIYNGGVLTLTADVFKANSSAVDSPYLKRAHHRHVHAPARASKRVRIHPALCPSGSDVYGGAVYNHASLTISGTTFDANVLSNVDDSCFYGYGGAIFNDEYGTLSSSHDTYTGNVGYYGGAVYNDSEYGNATFASDTFDGNHGCDVHSGCPTTTAGYGGAIYDAGTFGISVAGTTFENNTTGNAPGGFGEGGALYLDGGSPSITGSTFQNNFAGNSFSNCTSGYGGAIVMDGDQLNINGDTFTGNVAGGDYYGYGGAIVSYSPVYGDADTFTSNKALGTGSLCADSTTAYAYAGAIYSDDSESPITISNSTFSKNSAQSSYVSYGGAFYNNAVSRLIGDVFDQNQAIADSTTDQYTYSYGGAIYNDYNLSLSGSTFTGNGALVEGTYGYESYGGAIYNDDLLVSNGNAFTSNYARGIDYDYAYAYGGALYTEDDFSSKNDTFKSNVADSTYESYGGALANDDTMTAAGDSFVDNAATSGYESYGGAFFNESAATVSGSIFSSNTAGGNQSYGGAIYDEGGLTLNGGTVTNNKTAAGGGGIYTDHTDTISNTLIAGNSVTNAPYEYGGGGVYVDSTTTIVNTTIIGNAVKGNSLFTGGGGIYDDSALAMTGSTVSGNTAAGTTQGSGGGGIFLDDSATITNSTISNNTSSASGGGLENYYESSVLQNVTLFANTAATSGGNIDNQSTNASALTIGSTAIGGGKAVTGRDVNNAGAMVSADYNVVQTKVIGNALTGTTSHDQTANPELLALSNNGGPTFTNADTATSPGKADIPYTVGTGCNAAGVLVDQRGFTRGAGGRCDVGAYEYGGIATAIRPAIPSVRSHREHRHQHRALKHPAPVRPVGFPQPYHRP
jgi:hypothetical protein